MSRIIERTRRIEAAQLEIVRLRDQLTELSEKEERSEQEETLLGELPEAIADAERELEKWKAIERALAPRPGDPPERERAEPAPERRPFAIAKKKIEPADFLIRSAAIFAVARIQQQPLDLARRNLYGDDEATLTVLRAVTNPATTTAPTWAAELVETALVDFLDRLMPAAVYPALAGMGARYTFGRAGALKIPGRANTPTLAGDWVGEGAPKPVKQAALTAVTLAPHKLAVISVFTEELAAHSTPAIEGVIRQAMADDTAQALDGYLVDAVSPTAVRPAGLRAGVAGLTPTATGTNTEKMVADLKQLVSAITAAGGGRNLAILMNPAQAMSMGFAQTTTGDFLFADTGEAGQKFNVRFIVSNSIPAGTIICVDAADFATATGDTPRFRISEDATLHMETVPLPLATGAQGSAVVASPMRSLFQTDTIGVRMVLDVSWIMRRTGMVSWMEGVTW